MKFRRCVYRDAALVEPLACVLRGLEETGIRAGDTLHIGLDLLD
jgi:hypothetical protein